MKLNLKTTIYLSLGLHKGRPSYKRSLQLSKENMLAFQKRKFLNFFILLWVIFALLASDPDSEYESGSTDLIKSESNPDPKPCKKSKTSLWGESNGSPS